MTVTVNWFQLVACAEHTLLLMAWIYILSSQVALISSTPCFCILTLAPCTFSWLDALKVSEHHHVQIFNRDYQQSLWGVAELCCQVKVQNMSSVGKPFWGRLLETHQSCALYQQVRLWSRPWENSAEKAPVPTVQKGHQMDTHQHHPALSHQPPGHQRPTLLWQVDQRASRGCS